MEKFCQLSFVFLYAVLTSISHDFATARSCYNKACLKYGSVPKSVYRHRPQFKAHHDTPTPAKPIHKYLLLLTDSVYEELLQKCSTIRVIQDLSRLKFELSPNVFLPNSFVIFHIGSHQHKYHYTGILPSIENVFGNVSVYTDKELKYEEIANDCNDISIKCTRLESLKPIVEDMKDREQTIDVTGRRHSFGQISSTAVDVPDSRWLPVTVAAAYSPLTTTSSSGNIISISRRVDYELQLLALSLCATNRRYNFYYDLLIKSLAKLTLYNDETDLEEDTPEEPKQEWQEWSLSLEDILPKNPKRYDMNRAPKIRGQPTIVNFHVTVLSLDSINEESMTYVADIFLAQSWQDQRLRLPEDMREDYRILNVEWLHNIWKPDCFFKNAKQVTFHEISVPNHYLWLYHDKTLLYMSKLSLVLSCAMKFESYPHDTQVCSMMIESLSHTTHDLVFKWNSTDPLVLNLEIELPQLDIVHNYTSDCTNVYSTGNFTCLAVVFSLRRRLGYHLFHTYIPSALIVVMSWISFWIKPEAIPARVTLGVTSLLTLATQNTQSQQSLPPVSYVKAIDIWMSSCSIFVFLSLMEFAVVNNYMGPVATKVMKGYSDEDITLREEMKTFASTNTSPVRSIAMNSPQYTTFCHGRAVALYIDKFSRIFFPFSFLLLNVVYWTSFL